MRLVKIEISGFKSFKDKVTIEVPAKIVAIVGPNGCGKSNIVDAVKWALGEQNPKYLRGKHMGDIIFAGTSEFAPVGMAEVSLHFQKTSIPFPEPYSNLNEFVITRRLYRSGEAEYLINKSTCRLKDIQDITVDTGLGQRFYGLIEQGMIESFMNYKPDEKRLIFEEVAGTAKYRLRKKATIQKLEAAQLNLERVEDIIVEVKNRCDSLEKEAARALEYKKIFDELKKIELYVSSENLKKQKDFCDVKNKELDELLKEIESKEIDLNKLDSELEIDKNNLFFLEQEDVKLNKTFSALVERKTSVEKEYLSVKEGKSFRKEKINELKTHLLNIDEKLKSLAVEKDGLQKLILEKEKNIKEKEAQLRLNEDKERLLRNKIRGTEEKINSLQKEIIKDKNQLAYVNSQIAYEDKVYADALKKIELLKNEENTINDEILLLNGVIDEAKKQIRSLKDQKNEIEQKILDGNNRLLETKKALSDLRRNLQDKSLKRERLLGTYNSVKKMLEEYKGLSSGTQHLLKNFDRNDVLGTIVEHIDVKHDFMTAFENFLRDKLEIVLVKDMEAAQKALVYLKENKLGSCILCPISLIDNSNETNSDILNGYVKAEGEIRNILSTLFKNVVIVKNLKEAFENYKEDKKKTYLTLEGDILDEFGMIFGGSREKHNPYMIEKARLKEIERDLNNFESEIIDLKAKCSSKENEIKTIEMDLNNLKSELDNINVELSEDSLELRHKEEELKRKNNKKQELNLELKNMEINRATYEKKRIEFVKSSEELSKKILEKEELIIQKNNELEAFKKEIDFFTTEITNIKIGLAEEKRNYQHIHENLLKLKSNHDNLVREKSNIERELGAMLELHLEAEKKIEQREKDLEIIRNEEKVLAEKKKDMEVKLDELRVKIRENEHMASKLRAHLEKQRKQASSLKDRLTELTLKLENMVERIREKYFVDLNLHYTEYLNFEIEKEKCKNEYIDELRKKLNNMGDVNLLSIDEYEEVKQRLDFLCKQKADLKSSIDSLNKAIDRINAVSLELFMDSLKNVAENFDKIFKRLFGGGKAKIILTEDENPLESGVDIIVEPPHKKFQSINLLSGGEKALVTLSLIFAFYMQKPSPFCILDEVDAPLDDANVLKFRELLEEMSKISQFMVVSHNKSVMESADVLFGVTMETPGVSKLVAVKTHKGV